MERNSHDPSQQNERMREVASIFAAGILRLHTRAALTPATSTLAVSENLSNSAPNGLEVLPETRLSVHPG